MPDSEIPPQSPFPPEADPPWAGDDPTPSPPPEPEPPFRSATAPPPPPAPERPKTSSNLTRNFLLGVIVLAMTVAGTGVVYLLVKQQKSKNPRPTAEQTSQMEQEFSELKKKYDELETDRNNVLSQTRTLLQEKAQWQGTQEQLENLKKTNKVFMAQKEKLLAENQKLKAEVESVIQNFDGLKQSYQDLLAKQEESDKENAALRDLLTKQVQAAPEYQLLDREAKRLAEENEKFGQTINLMENKLKLALDRIKKDQQRELNMLRQVRGQKDLLEDVRAQNEILSRTNKELNDLINQAPGHIKDMAFQNQALVKETAEMHYNMGVFFSENKKFEQAEREYARALEFDPNSLKVHYNLGYLYAEDLNNHDKAMFHLEKYLQMDPNSKESEAIRSYIASRQAWNAGASSSGKRR